MKISNLWLWLAISHIKKMHEESIYSYLKFSGIKCGKYLIHHVQSQQYISVNFEHLMLGEINPAFFSDDLAANDVLLFVDPSFRSNGIAKKLLDDFSQWAEVRGAKLITVGQSTGCNTNQFKSLIKKSEYQPLGAVYGRAPCAEEK